MKKAISLSILLFALWYGADAQVFIGGNIQNDVIADVTDFSPERGQLFNYNAGYTFRFEKVPGLSLDFVPLQFTHYRPPTGKDETFSWSVSVFWRYYIPFKGKS